MNVAVLLQQSRFVSALGVATATAAAMSRVCIALSLLIALVKGNLRGAEPGPKCVGKDSTCNPTANSCCQGPGLMTCRLRPSDIAGDEGMAYKCDEEFPKQSLPDPSCTPEGQECSSDLSCCNPFDAFDRSISMTCQPDDGPKKRRICKKNVENLGAEAACVLEGNSCNPLENKCCQDSHGLGLGEMQRRQTQNLEAHSARQSQ